MKFRIVENEIGKFQIEYKDGILSFWNDVTEMKLISNHKTKRARYVNEPLLFNSKEEAQNKINEMTI